MFHPLTHSSSFVIEFREDSLRSRSGSAIVGDGSCVNSTPLSGNSSSQSTASGNDTEENLQSCDNSATVSVNGCFSKALLSGRDELSFEGDTYSLSTTDDHEAERRGKTSVIKYDYIQTTTSSSLSQIASQTWLLNLRHSCSFRCSCVRRPVSRIG